MGSKIVFGNIKSKNILKEIFYYLKENKLLNIIRYNKFIQSRIDKKVNYYKYHYEKIELELFPIKNKHGKFINMRKKQAIHFHFYFNDNNNEINRNYIIKDENISKIKTIVDYEIKNLDNLFSIK